MPSYPSPPASRTDNFVPTPSNVCWTINESLRKNLGCLSVTGCDETGSMLSRVALLDCLGDAIASFIGCWKVAQKLDQNATQNSPTMQFHATRTQAPSTRIRLCLKTEIFPLRLRKNARAQVAYSLSRPHENAKTKFINLHFFSSF